MGIIEQREDDPRQALEPIDLMIRATEAAGHDAGAPELLPMLDEILVPIGRWPYRNPGGLIGRAVGSPSARTTSALPGVSQQTILTNAASAIADGTITAALVRGGEGGYTLRQARRHDVELTYVDDPTEPDIELRPADTIVPDHERNSGLGVMPVGYYALMDSAYRRAAGVDVDTRRHDTAALYHRFSQIAAANPHGWGHPRHVGEGIRSASMHAFPYTRHHVSNWSVDQASALLLTSVATAERLGIASSKWVFPQAFTESNHMVDVTARGQLHRCIGAELACRGRARSCQL